MVEYILEITLQSPLTSAAGEGRVGVADRDIAFDDLGLPILPGRRLKGLWREAYLDVFDAWTLCGESPIPVEDVFGKLGQAQDSTNVDLHIGNAALKEAESLKPWLSYLQDPRNQKMFPEDVVQHYANVRLQTAVDRHTGAAKENTLRSTRTLRAGLVFRAPVRFATLPGDAIIAALESGAAALQYMGTARTRGLGKVYCRFFKADSTDPVPDGGTGSASTVSGLGVPTHILRYRLTLRESVVVPTADGDPNTIVTRQNIPGSHLWGVAAWHYLNQGGNTTDPAFRHAFLDGGLRFLTAYPESLNNEKQRLIPIPHSIRKLKTDESLVDFVEDPPNILDEDQTKRHDHSYCRINSQRLETQSVKTERNYHHARAKDRRKGRALGTEVPDGGAFFTYEAIKAGQSFQGAVLGAESDLQNLQKWLKGVGLMRLGRSRSAQYGEVKFGWFGDVQELNGLSESNGFNTRQVDSKEDWHADDLGEDDRWDEDEIWDEDENAEWDEDETYAEDGMDEIIERQNTDKFNLGEQLVITTLSPLLTVNERGHPEACFPEHELAIALGLDTSEKNLTLSHSYTRTELVSGYSAHLRLPRQQLPAVAAGSVFVFDIKDFQGCITLEQLLKLEHNGLGLRKGEGYGRIAIDRLKIDKTKEEMLLDDPEHQTHRQKPSETEIPEEVAKFLQDITRTRCLAKIQQRAMAAAAEKKIRKIPSNSLLGKLRLFLQLDPTNAIDNLKNLPKLTKERLRDCQIDTNEGDTLWLAGASTLTLYDLFETAWTKPTALLDSETEHEKGFWSGLLEIVANHRYTDMDGTEVDRLVDEMCKVFLNYLLTALHRGARR